MPVNREAQLRGCRNGSLKAARWRRERAKQADQRFGLAALVVALRAEGRSLQAVANELTGRGIWTRGCAKRWYAAQVARILQRALEDGEATIARLEAEAGALKTILAREAERQQGQ